MPRNEPTEVTDEWGGGRSPRRRKAVRYAVPAAVAGVAAATIGLVPAFAGSGSPDLPQISAQELIAKMAKSDVRQLSGTVRVSADLGLPSLPGGGIPGGFGGGGDRGKNSASADPQQKLLELASGAHTLRVAADGPDRQRLSIVGQAAEYSLIHNGDDAWAYDSGSNTVVHRKAPGGTERGKRQGLPGGMPKELPRGLQNATPQDLAKEALKAADATTSVEVDGTAKVAGRDAYQLSIKPKQAGSTVGAIRIAVDADNGVPLKFTLTPKSGGAAVIDVGYTNVDFTRPDASTFAFTPPKGAKVVNAKEAATEQAGAAGHPGSKDRAPGKGRAPGQDSGPGKDFTPGGHGAPGKGLKDADGPGGVNVIGKGWTSIATIKGAGAGLPSGKDKGATGDAGKFLDSIGEKVTGGFGSGRVFSTRLVNALVTDDGTIYVGAVDKDSLIAAADGAK
ncbi:outer membrane lipoprotein carrier protein LolA [Streptomyces sp. NPDC017993]|uniref:outer membrane lipoprotein carrier protein LolA n=1 Tax=Streptomyces sp. NPDC017993 TaxID=3365027 RepID=UPI00379474F3